jgi:hypothetical protein
MYFSEDATAAVSFREMVYIKLLNVVEIVWAVFEKFLQLNF